MMVSLSVTRVLHCRASTPGIHARMPTWRASSATGGSDSSWQACWPSRRPAATARPRVRRFPLSIAVPAQVEGHLTTCTTCSDGPTVVVQFAVTVVDASGPGGTVATLDTRVINQSRGTEIAHNVRPNGDVGLSASAVPAGGQVTVDSGIGFPAPPPRDSLTVTVTIRMTDGREASASAALVVVI